MKLSMILAEKMKYVERSVRVALREKEKKREEKKRTTSVHGQREGYNSSLILLSLVKRLKN